MSFCVYTAQERGARNRQEDRVVVDTVREMTFAALADGMGGMPMGAEAAEETIISVTSALKEQQRGEPLELLVDAAKRANRNVARLGNRFGFPGLCGSTLVCVLATDDLVWWLSVGDSRIYLYRNADLVRLTTDHSAGGGGGLTSFIGRMSEICLPAEPLKPEAGDMFVLASDGLWNTVPETKIAETLAPHQGDPAEALVRGVMSARNPFQDNVSALVLYRES